MSMECALSPITTSYTFFSFRRSKVQPNQVHETSVLVAARKAEGSMIRLGDQCLPGEIIHLVHIGRSELNTSHVSLTHQWTQAQSVFINKSENRSISCSHGYFLQSLPNVDTTVENLFCGSCTSNQFLPLHIISTMQLWKLSIGNRLFKRKQKI